MPMHKDTSATLRPQMCYQPSSCVFINVRGPRLREQASLLGCLVGISFYQDSIALLLSQVRHTSTRSTERAIPLMYHSGKGCNTESHNTLHHRKLARFLFRLTQCHTARLHMLSARSVSRNKEYHDRDYREP